MQKQADLDDHKSRIHSPKLFHSRTQYLELVGFKDCLGVEDESQHHSGKHNIRLSIKYCIYQVSSLLLLSCRLREPKKF
jgi:hypothetical protein